MLQLMAMEQIDPSIGIEADRDLHPLSILEKYRVLPDLLPGEDTPPTSAARQDLEMSAVDVAWMRRSAVTLELPDLRLAKGHTEVDMVHPVLAAVDPAVSLEAERSTPGARSNGQARNRRKSGRDDRFRVAVSGNAHLQHIPSCAIAP